MSRTNCMHDRPKFYASCLPFFLLAPATFSFTAHTRTCENQTDGRIRTHVNMPIQSKMVKPWKDTWAVNIWIHVYSLESHMNTWNFRIVLVLLAKSKIWMVFVTNLGSGFFVCWLSKAMNFWKILWIHLYTPWFGWFGWICSLGARHQFSSLITTNENSNC